MEVSKINTAYERFRWAAKEAERLFDMPLVVQYSGGKDSDVILQLAKESGVPFRVTHNLTTADPPDNVYYIRRVFAALREEGIDCRINVPRRSLWRIMRETLVIPSRIMRVCCSELKERRMPDAPYIVTGVRWAESAGRRAREIAFARYPKLYKAWRDAIAYVIERRKEMGNPMFLEGKEVESVEDVLGTWCAGRLRGGWMNT